MTTAIKNIIPKLDKKPAAEQNVIAALLNQELGCENPTTISNQNFIYWQKKQLSEIKKGSILKQ